MGMDLQRIQEAADLGRHELARWQQGVHRKRRANMVLQQAPERAGLDGCARDAVAGERRLQPDVGVRTDELCLFHCKVLGLATWRRDCPGRVAGTGK